MSDRISDDQLTAWADDPGMFPVYYQQPEHDNHIQAMAAELLELRARVAAVTAMVDHGSHSEDPDDHNCAVSPCWAVVLQRALGLEVARVSRDE